MTSTSQTKAQTLTLKAWQVKSIVHNMGWDPEDADAFLKMARREMDEPGIHDREEAAYFRSVIERDNAALSE